MIHCNLYLVLSRTSQTQTYNLARLGRTAFYNVRSGIPSNLFSFRRRAHSAKYRSHSRDQKNNDGKIQVAKGAIQPKIFARSRNPRVLPRIEHGSSETGFRMTNHTVSTIDSANGSIPGELDGAIAKTMIMKRGVCVYRACAFVIGGFLSFGSCEEANGAPSSACAARAGEKFDRPSSHQTVVGYRPRIDDEEYRSDNPARRARGRATEM